ncbi:MAG: YbaB/EbfC family nucleoid-associated protein [Parcubacteria group bacterium]
MLDKLKQLNELRQQAQQMKELLANETAFAEAEDGKVRVVVNGNHEIMAVEIDPILLSPQEKQRVEAAIKNATNEATKKIQRAIAMKVQSGNFSFPGLT